MKRFIAAATRTLLARVDLALPPIGSPSYVLGSAPSFTGIPKTGGPWTVVTVNASQATAERLGVPIPDVTVMNDKMLGDQPVNRAAKAILSGRRCRTLVLIQRGISVQESYRRLREIRYDWDNLVLIDHWWRSKITWRVTGRMLAARCNEEKVSTGFFAIFLMRYLTAKPIVLDGFSLSKQGHAYNQLGHRRRHVGTDKSALRSIRKIPHIYTCNAEFAKEAALPIYGASAPCQR